MQRVFSTAVCFCRRPALREALRLFGEAAELFKKVKHTQHLWQYKRVLEYLSRYGIR